jgi:hypothetical protein
MFENRKHKVLPRKQFIKRQLRFTFYALVLIGISLLIGIAGYMATAQLSFTDALLNSSMILTGMGPVDHMPNEGAKYFASFYALYSGIAFLSTVTIFLAPAVHRFFHLIHMDESGNN